MPDTIQDFDAFRSRMNDLILGAGNLTINRFFALDQRAYEPGALGTRTKEMLGLVASLVLRCDDCVTYHVVRCREEGVTREEFLEIFSVGLVVGGSIVIPHLRRAMARLEELEPDARPLSQEHRRRRDRDQRRQAHVNHRPARPHDLHAAVPDQVGHEQREDRGVGDRRPALPAYPTPVHAEHRRQAREQQHRGSRHRGDHGDAERRDLGRQHPQTERVAGPADHRAQAQQIARQGRLPEPGAPRGDHEHHTRRGDDHSAQHPRPERLEPQGDRQDGHDRRHGGEDECAVRRGSAVEARDPAELVERVAHDAEHDQAGQRAARDGFGPLQPAHQRHQQEARQGEPDRGEGERWHPVERALGDAEVDAPDEGDEQHAQIRGERGTAGRGSGGSDRGHAEQ
jgi:AhpD family alkylhydroperoxidase